MATYKRDTTRWYEFDSDGLNRLVETLYRRRPIIRDLITQFRDSCRNPFPPGPSANSGDGTPVVPEEAPYVL